MSPNIQGGEEPSNFCRRSYSVNLANLIQYMYGRNSKYYYLNLKVFRK
jgi:hypothetical protein